MSEWSRFKLENLIQVKHGFAFPGKGITSSPTNNILVTPGNFYIGGGFKGEKFKYYNLEVPTEYILKGGDIVITMTDLSKETDTLGYPAIIPHDSNGKEFLHNQRIGLVKIISNEIDKNFLYWRLRANDYHHFIKSTASGTTVMHTSPKRIVAYEFTGPLRNEQHAIAEVLSSIDDKIDLLNRQNETLEAMAQTLFRQWFIEEADDSWEEVYLTDEFDFVMGQSPSGKSFNEDRNGIAMFQGNADFTFRFPKNRVYTTEPTRYANKYDTLISVRAPVGAQNMAFEDCCIGRGLSAFRHKKGLFKTYTYQKLNSLMSEIRSFNDTGTVFGSISKKDFQLIKTNMPPIDVIKNFEHTAGAFEDRIHNNCEKIEKLHSIRDTLLPKLMSGQVRVKLD